MDENEVEKRIRELEEKVKELEALIKTRSNQNTKTIFSPALTGVEEQIKKNQAGMDWAKQRMQAIKDKWGEQ